MDLNQEQPLRKDDSTRVLLTVVSNGIVMKIDDPINEIPLTSVYDLESPSIDDDMNRNDPEKVQAFLYDLMDALSLHPSDRAKKELSIVVEDRKDE